MIGRLRAALVAAAVAVSAQPVLAETANDPTELARTWDAARVWLPQQPASASSVAELEEANVPGAIVLYAHGCDGITRITDQTARFLARAGHAVIAPDSFARQRKPVSCFPASRQGSMHREVLAWRHAELKHALDALAAIPALNELPVVLMGHSEGAIAVATLDAPPVAARVIEGWTCHAGWPEYRGVNTARDEPILALVGENDPWFRKPVLQGDCGAFMSGHQDDRSVVLRAPSYLHNRHWLSFDAHVQAIILGFIGDSVGRSER